MDSRVSYKPRVVGRGPLDPYRTRVPLVCPRTQSLLDSLLTRSYRFRKSSSLRYVSGSEDG